MIIGDVVKRRPETFGESEQGVKELRKPMYGTVIYIHPAGRYHMVEFDIKGKKLRECFKGT